MIDRSRAVRGFRAARREAGKLIIARVAFETAIGPEFRWLSVAEASANRLAIKHTAQPH